MKRVLFFTLLINVFGLGFAQSIYFRGGTSISKLDWEEYDLYYAPIKRYYDNMIGYSFGVGTKYLNKSYFNLDTFLGLVEKGGKQFVEYENFSEPLINEIRYACLQYLNLTTMIELTYKFHNRIHPYVSIGPRLGYLVSTSYQFELIKERNELSRINYGINFRLGCTIDFDKIFLGVSWSKNANFNKIAEYPTGPGLIGGTLIDRTMFLNLDFGFDID